MSISWLFHRDYRGGDTIDARLAEHIKSFMTIVPKEAYESATAWVERAVPFLLKLGPKQNEKALTVA